MAPRIHVPAPSTAVTSTVFHWRTGPTPFLLVLGLVVLSGFRTVAHALSSDETGSAHSQSARPVQHLPTDRSASATMSSSVGADYQVDAIAIDIEQKLTTGIARVFGCHGGPELSRRHMRPNLSDSQLAVAIDPLVGPAPDASRDQATRGPEKPCAGYAD